MNNIGKKFVAIIFTLILCLVLTTGASSQGVGDEATRFLNASGQESGLGSDPASPATIGARIINVFLGILGVLFVGLIVYGGFRYMSSGGNEQQALAARKVIRDAIIGLIIIFIAFAITRFVIGNVQTAIITTDTSSNP